MNGLREFLSKDIDQCANSDGYLSISGNFVVPGYWVALTAYCRLKKIDFEQLQFCSEKTKGYASAIALAYALNGIDSYPYERKNSGRNYSELVHLISPEDTDKANGTINSCIRELFSGYDMPSFVSDLCDVVGDLHDNVWSHGMSTGFSMAQIWPKFNRPGHCFEFALADCGHGFLRELRRVGLEDIKDDEAAIEWCVQKGNSSKTLKQPDEWGQRLPSDITGNPMPGIGQVVVSDNRHMGLGLAKLVELVHNYKGYLWLATGETTLEIRSNGEKNYKNNKQKWQGVVLACRFETEKAKEYIADNDDEITTSLIDLLRV